MTNLGNPYIPAGWEVLDHRPDGQWREEAFIYRPEDDRVSPYDLSATALDWYVANPDKIPRNWKNQPGEVVRCVVFRATKYRTAGGNIVFRELHWQYWLGPLRWVWSYAGIACPIASAARRPI